MGVAVIDVAGNADTEVAGEEVVHAETAAEAVIIMAAADGVGVAGEYIELKLNVFEARLGSRGFEVFPAGHFRPGKTGGGED